MKNIWYLALGFLFFFAVYLYSDSLAIKDRSSELIHQIEGQFLKARSGGYSFYGQSETDYGSNIFVYSWELAYALIKSAQENQKVFNLIDIGAGRGGWGDGLVKFLNKKPDLDNDITINIIGLTAQEFPSDNVKVTEGKCKKYLIGNFNAEFFNLNLHKLEENGLDIKNKIDLAVSNNTFTHLVDPLGTLIEIYNNLHPITGMIFFDNFFLNISRGGGQFEGQTIASILPFTNVQFLIPSANYSIKADSSAYFLIRRKDDNNLNIPFSYGPLESFKNINSGSWPRASYILNEEIGINPLKEQYIHQYHQGSAFEIQVLGSPDSDSLYDWLINHEEEFGRKTSKWQSAFEDDTTVKTHK